MVAWMTGQDIAEIAKVPLGTVQRWASEGNWLRIRRGPQVLYDWEAAAERIRRRIVVVGQLDATTSGEASSNEYEDF